MNTEEIKTAPQILKEKINHILSMADYKNILLAMEEYKNQPQRSVISSEEQKNVSHKILYEFFQEGSRSAQRNQGDFDLEEFIENWLHNNSLSPPTENKEPIEEISDEEIVGKAKEMASNTSWCDPYSFEEGMKAYRSELKRKEGEK